MKSLDKQDWCPNCQSNNPTRAITLNNTCPECGRKL